MAIISLKKFKPLSPGVRWRRKIKLNKKLPRIPKFLTAGRKWHAGRNVNGRVCFRYFMKRKFKKRVQLETAKLSFYDIAISANYHYSFEKNKPKISFLTKNGSAFLLPSTLTNLPGRVYYSLDPQTPTYNRCFSGLPVILTAMPFYTRVSNVTTQPFYKYQYATSSGSFCTKLRAPKREKNIKLILPSKQYKYFPVNSLAIIGPNTQLWTYKIVLGKAGNPRSRGIKQRVRGVAMNSVDHPHGGKANSVQPEVSPWGWVTKKSH